MKFKKSLLVLCTLIVFSFIFVGAADPKKSENPKSPVIIGKIEEVQKSDDGKTTKIIVEGYIKDREVKSIKIIGIIDDTTKIMNSNKDKNIELNKGDLVYMRVQGEITDSNPSEIIVKRMFVTKSK